MENIHQILEGLQSTSQRSILATIIQVDGSAYRKVGTSMLFQKDGTQIGTISAGCLEEDILMRMNEVWNNNQSQTVLFDMKNTDDLSWGQGSGCNGIIHVLLEPVDDLLHNHLHTLKSYLNEGKSVTIVKKFLSDFSVSDYIFITEDQHIFGEWRDEIQNPIQNSQYPQFRSGTTFIKELSAYVYTHHFRPKPRLILWGAGNDAIPLAKIASEIGFSVIVSDWRPALCNKNKFPTVDQLIVGFPTEVMPKMKITACDFVVILTHNFQRDKEILQLLISTECNYLGILGSKLRTTRLLNGEEIPAKIITPVGLPIGAEGAEEISISILAELIQIQRKQIQ